MSRVRTCPRLRQEARLNDKRHLTRTQEHTMATQIDARGPRFAATLTTLVLAVALVTKDLIRPRLGPADADRGRRTASFRGGRGSGLRRRGAGRLPVWRDPVGNRDRVRTRRSVPERRVRVLPGVRDLPA